MNWKVKFEFFIKPDEWQRQIEEDLVFKLTNLSLLWLLWFDVLLKENQQFWPLIGWQVMFSYHTHLQKDQ